MKLRRQRHLPRYKRIKANPPTETFKHNVGTLGRLPSEVLTQVLLWLGAPGAMRQLGKTSWWWFSRILTDKTIWSLPSLRAIPRSYFACSRKYESLSVAFPSLKPQRRDFSGFSSHSDRCYRNVELATETPNLSENGADCEAIQIYVQLFLQNELPEPGWPGWNRLVFTSSYLPNLDKQIDLLDPDVPLQVKNGKTTPLWFLISIMRGWDFPGHFVPLTWRTIDRGWVFPGTWLSFRDLNLIHGWFRDVERKNHVVVVNNPHPNVVCIELREAISLIEMVEHVSGPGRMTLSIPQSITQYATPLLLALQDALTGEYDDDEDVEVEVGFEPPLNNDSGLVEVQLTQESTLLLTPHLKSTTPDVQQQRHQKINHIIGQLYPTLLEGGFQL